MIEKDTQAELSRLLHETEHCPKCCDVMEWRDCPVCEGAGLRVVYRTGKDNRYPVYAQGERCPSCLGTAYSLVCAGCGGTL